MIESESDISVVSSLQQSCFVPDLKGRNKLSVLGELVDVLSQNGVVEDRDGVLAAVLERESQMSTGMQNGIALPHGKHASVMGLVSVIGTLPAGIDFDSLDGQPSRIFVMTISPPHTVGPHLRFLAAVGKMLGRDDVREAVLTATDKASLLQALA